MTSHLRAVEPNDPIPLPTRPLPDFEGLPVELTRLRLISASDLELSDDPMRIDDVVRLYVEGRVTRVEHVVADNGKIKRVHTVKVVDAITLPWDFDTAAFDG